MHFVRILRFILARKDAAGVYPGIVRERNHELRFAYFSSLLFFPRAETIGRLN